MGENAKIHLYRIFSIRDNTAFYKPEGKLLDALCLKCAIGRSIKMGENIFDEQKCRVCGCTWDHACEGGCYWIEDDLCSACAVKICNKRGKRDV